MPLVQEETGFVVFLAGVVDDGIEASPFMEIFLDHKASRYPGPADLQRFDLRPPEDQRLRRVES